MKRSLSLVCLLASTFGVSALAQTAAPTTPAAEPPAAPGAAAAAAPVGPTKVAVILFQPAVAQTNEGQRDFGKLRTKFEPRQSQLKQSSDEIDSLKKQLQTSGDKLTDAERQSRLRTIDEKEKALQRSAEDAQNDFTSEMNEMYQALAQKVAAVMQAYAQQQGYTVVLDASQQQAGVLWAAQSTNITEAVVAAYNAKSGVPVQPAPAGATTGAAAPRTIPSRTPGTTAPRTPR
ncbi:MAG: OmpH family outer membrane protein [Acidobacteriaceae bacterium]